MIFKKKEEPVGAESMLTIQRTFDLHLQLIQKQQEQINALTRAIESLLPSRQDKEVKT